MLGNILILRGDIEILPPSRVTVSYEFLSQLVAEYLLQRSPDVDISAALSIMPRTQRESPYYSYLHRENRRLTYPQDGMDLNPLFNAAMSFRPGGAGGELKLFEQAGIQLVHGWLVDPESAEAKALEVTPDYDSAVTLLAGADHLTQGEFVGNRDAVPQAGPSNHTNLPDHDRQKIETGNVALSLPIASILNLPLH